MRTGRQRDGGAVDRHDVVRQIDEPLGERVCSFRSWAEVDTAGMLSTV